MGMKKSNALGMLAMMMAMSESTHPDFDGIELKKEKKPIKKPIPKGLTEFFYGEHSIYALNKKNADRKARKKGYL